MMCNLLKIASNEREEERIEKEDESIKMRIKNEDDTVRQADSEKKRERREEQRDERFSASKSFLIISSEDREESKTPGESDRV